MRVGIIGAGYVGLVTGVGFALKGNQVTCLDVDAGKVDKINNKFPPIFEIGLKEALAELVPSKLSATTDFDKLVQNSDVIFISVGTPALKDGSQNLSYIRSASEKLAVSLSKSRDFKVVVVKSTVLPGTTRKVVKETIEKFAGKKAGKDFGLASNPEFLREGKALNDFMYPDRVVIGTIDEKTESLLYKLYSNFEAPILVTSLEAAEMIKYTSNSFLALKISFINEIGSICKQLGVDTYDVAKGIGLDKRIGPAFLNAGLGWGGSCFPKDTSALISLAKEKGLSADILKASIAVNEKQSQVVLNVVKDLSPKVKTIGLLGLAFKPDTDDVRDSQVLPLVELLVNAGYNILAFDPQGMNNFKAIYPSKAISYAKTGQEAVDKSDCVLIVTEWTHFEKLNYGNKRVIDTRNVVPKEKRSVNYYGLYW